MVGKGDPVETIILTLEFTDTIKGDNSVMDRGRKSGENSSNEKSIKFSSKEMTKKGEGTEEDNGVMEHG